jgi:hypothetical protein
MDYPPSLIPTSGPRTIPKATPIFQPWTKAPPGDSYGHKQFLDYNGRSLFAELVILQMFQDVGWDGVWVDSFRRRFWTGYQQPSAGLPTYPEGIVRRIRGDDGFPRGCWDVICWRGNDIVFAEAKRAGKDRIRPTQARWLSDAIDKAGLRAESFLVVEWSVKGT